MSSSISFSLKSIRSKAKGAEYKNVLSPLQLHSVGNKYTCKKRLKGFPAIYIFFVLLIICPAIEGQELSNIGKAPLLNINGGVSLNQTMNWDDIAGSHQQPYAYILSANLNFSIYGWNIPLSALYSNKNWSYQQPFNQFSLNPSYKWIKLYVGYNSMSFSSYTLNGHRFMGGGAELTPAGKWKFSAMAGRMQERIFPDSAGYIQPAYTRFGTGFKTEYMFGTGNIALSTFYARDNPRSLSGYDSLSVTPQENLALALSTNFNIQSFLTISAEYSTSLFTEDIYSLPSDDKYALMPVYNRRQSTRNYQALKANVVYNSRIGSIGAGMERVEPGYRTLGTYTTVNDFVNYTINYAGQIIPEKVSIAASIGLQNDDLEEKKAQKNNRRVGSLNLGFTPVQAVNANLSYGNFRNYTHVRSGFEDINNTNPYPYADTLDFTQVSENIGASLSIAPKGNEKVKRNFLLSMNYQIASEQQSDNPDHSSNRFFNGIFGYNQTYVKRSLTFSASYNYNRNKADSIISTTTGPSLSLRKGFFDKKLNTSFSAAYNQGQVNGEIQSKIFIVRSGIAYALKEKHNFDLGIAYANRNSLSRHQHNNSITVTLAYRYNFKGITFGERKNRVNENNEKLEDSK